MKRKNVESKNIINSRGLKMNIRKLNKRLMGTIEMYTPSSTVCESKIKPRSKELLQVYSRDSNDLQEFLLLF